jgi:hypothetical protein
MSPWKKFTPIFVVLFLQASVVLNICFYSLMLLHGIPGFTYSIPKLKPFLLFRDSWPKQRDLVAGSYTSCTQTKEGSFLPMT